MLAGTRRLLLTTVKFNLDVWQTRLYLRALFVQKIDLYQQALRWNEY